MFLKLVALLLCITYATCDYVQSTDCVNTTVHSRNVRMEVSGCSSSDEHCPLYRGTNHTVIFTFEPTEPFMATTDSRVYGVFEKFTVPYGGRANACSPASTTDDNTSCPSLGGFLADREYKHNSIFSVSKNYPMIKLRVRFMFYDRKSKQALLCREVAVEIKAAPTPSENEA